METNKKKRWNKIYDLMPVLISSGIQDALDKVFRYFPRLGIHWIITQCV